MDTTSASNQTRPPDSSASGSFLTSDSPPLHSHDGVVVVGFICRRPDDSSQLINRLLDSNVFGSGNLDKALGVDKDEARDWFARRKISYYLEEERGILFLQFCPTRCPAFDGLSDLHPSGCDSVYEEREFGDLQGLLFMFTVCHVVIYMLEGSHFNSQILKKLRVLQATKQALVPFIKSRMMPPSTSRAHSSFPARSLTPVGASSNSSVVPGGIVSRNASYASLLPGQCTPVMLFVFLDDYSDLPNSTSNVEESMKTSSSNYSSNMGGLTRSTVRGSGSVVMLARPGSKSELSLRKKLQSSLEAQIKFLIKKCRTLSSSETSHPGSRSSSISSSIPLFLLDASKAVVLVDRCTNRKGESLEFATSLVEDVLNGKASSDSLLLDSSSHSVTQDDVSAVKEFIYRQAEILRGRGGLTNANSGSGHGVGMVAVAAAVAAASASSGKASTTPELPTFDLWLSQSRIILLDIIKGKSMFVYVVEDDKKKTRQRNVVPVRGEGGSKRLSSLDAAVSWLSSGRGLNTKFSTLWCERSLPVARDIYMKDLPACYPTSVHEMHLQEALNAFNTMVRGPSVEDFTKRLKDECTSIWKSGRQLCDAVSLTGKPCIHQKHDIGTAEFHSREAVNNHSSGYVFLRACACGRSRSLYADPFDFESANSNFNCFSDCDNVLPNAKLPELSTQGPVRSSSWSLIRVGNSRYYEPYKGLLQSGFCASQKFLLRWTINLDYQSFPYDSRIGVKSQNSAALPMTNSQVVSNVEDIIDSASTLLYTGEARTGNIKHGKLVENGAVVNDKKSFGRSPCNVDMKKPFSEVVAGLAAMDSVFPPLQQNKQNLCGHEKRIKQKDLQAPNMVVGETGGNPPRHELKIQQQDVPKDISVNTINGEKVRSQYSMSHVAAFIGFEHECPRGHRFILNAENLNQLGYAIQETPGSPFVRESPNSKLNQLQKAERHGSYSRGRRKSNKMASASNKLRSIDKPRQVVDKGYLEAKEQSQTSTTAAAPPDRIGSLETSAKVDERGFSMTKVNLPLYMKCPYCLSAKEIYSDIKFAGRISQLQRIYMVTPPFPVVLSSCPVIQFQESCLPPSVPNRHLKLQFSLECPVILPPESFLVLRLPFVYGVQLDDGALLPLKPLEGEPEKTAWIAAGTALQIISKERGANKELQT